MTGLYRFPEQAYFGRVLSKTKIYKHASPTTKIKDLFVRQVEKIIWAYKLSPETINLPASDGVREIQVITIVLKTGTLKHEVLAAIDKAIPSPILFKLTYKGKSRYVATYKRPSEADKSKWVISSYFETGWIAENTGNNPLPVALNLEALYQALVRFLIPLSARENEPLEDLAARADQLRIKEREAVRLEASMEKEKQFNRKVELNRALNIMRQEIQDLKR
jgi:hypothetical protein